MDSLNCFYCTQQCLESQLGYDLPRTRYFADWTVTSALGAAGTLVALCLAKISIFIYQTIFGFFGLRVVELGAFITTILAPTILKILLLATAILAVVTVVSCVVEYAKMRLGN